MINVDNTTCAKNCDGLSGLEFEVGICFVTPIRIVATSVNK